MKLKIFENKEINTLSFRIWVLLSLVSMLLKLNNIIVILFLGVISYIFSRYLIVTPFYKNNAKSINRALLSLIPVLFLAVIYSLVSKKGFDSMPTIIVTILTFLVLVGAIILAAYVIKFLIKKQKK
jgi:hypothetical protein